MSALRPGSRLACEIKPWIAPKRFYFLKAAGFEYSPSVKLTSFDQRWNAVCSKLVPIPKLYHWSAAGRAKGSFRVSEVTKEGVTVRTTKGSSRFVPARDFAAILLLWPDYRDGKIQRYKLSFCVNSTYVVSILHWLELQP
jgi:hypothetical protein